MTAKDISRETTNVIFDPEISGEIISKAIDESAIMQLGTQIPMTGAGKKFQTITGDPEPEWVGETEEKATGVFEFGTKTVEPYKMALIVPFSMEFRRDKAALYDECVNRLPKLFGKKVDTTAMGTVAPGENFDVLGNCDKVSLIPAEGKTLYDQFIEVDAAIAEADAVMNGIALAPKGRSIVLSAVDADKHPLFSAGVQSGTVNPILGAPVSVRKGVYVPGTAGSAPDIVGLAGDYENLRYGIVQAITGSITDQATINVGTEANPVLLNLWQRNMFAVRFEMEIALMVKDPNAFKLLTGNTPSATTTTTTTTGA